MIMGMFLYPISLWGCLRGIEVIMLLPVLGLFRDLFRVDSTTH